MPTPRKDDSPFMCPVCAGPMNKVIDSRPDATGVYRRRKCAHGHRFSTRETIINRLTT